MAWFAHIGGFLAGMGLILLMPAKQPRYQQLVTKMWQEVNTGSAGIEKPLDILAIAAHPDDVEQTCGGTLIRMAEMGYRTGVLDLTAGDMGTRGTPEIRLKESDAAGCQMLLAWRGNMRLPDARLENTVSVRMSLAVEIRELRPRVVILPYWEARHPDHYRASEIGFEACFLAGLKKLDEDTEPHRPAQDPLLVALRQRHAVVRGGYLRAVRAPHGRAVLLRIAIRRRARTAARSVSREQQEIRERLGAIARFYGNSDRREVRRAVRGEGNHARGRHHRHGRAACSVHALLPRDTLPLTATLQRNCRASCAAWCPP